MVTIACCIFVIEHKMNLIVVIENFMYIISENFLDNTQYFLT